MEVVFQDGAVLRVLIFDIVPEERHVLGAEKTSFPIERAANRSDHHRAKTDPFTTSIVVSDTPVDGSGDGAQLTRRRDAWDLLRLARDQHLPCIVTTDLRTYDDMVLMEANATRTAKDGTWLKATVTFDELPVFDTELVPDPAADMPRARVPSPADIGPQGTTAAPLTSVGLSLGAALPPEAAAFIERYR